MSRSVDRFYLYNYTILLPLYILFIDIDKQFPDRAKGSSSPLENLKTKTTKLQMCLNEFLSFDVIRMIKNVAQMASAPPDSRGFERLGTTFMAYHV